MTRKNSTTAVRAAIYCRISRDTDGEAAGVARQRQDCLKHVEHNGWTIVADEGADTFTDNDISGAKDFTERLAFGRLIAAVKAGKVDAVVAYSQARVYRDVAGFLSFCETLKGSGVETIALLTDADVNPSGSLFIATIIAAKDAEERRRTGELTRRAHQQLAEAGMPNGGGRRAFGWRTSMEQDEAEAELVREAARRVLAGESLRAIRSDWEARGVPTVGGGPWAPSSIRAALTNPRNAGLRSHKGEIVGPAVWAPILDAKTYEQLASILSNPSRRTNGPNVTRRSYVLCGGLARCGLCGNALVGKPMRNPTPTDPERRRRVYVCTKDHGGCGKILVDAEHLEAEVIPNVLVWADDPGARAMVSQADNADSAEVSRLLVENAEDESLLIEWENLVMDRTISAATLRKRRVEVDDRIESRRDRIAELQGTSALASFSGPVSESWPVLSSDAQRTILSALVLAVWIDPAVKLGSNRFDPERVRVEWRIDTLMPLVEASSRKARESA